MRRQAEKAAALQKQSKVGKPYAVFVLQPAFKVLKGRLTIAAPPGELLGSPTEAFVSLYILPEEKLHAITQMSDLKGRVRIDSPEAALSFVRLFTSLTTHYLFDPPKLPIEAFRQVKGQDGAKLEVIARARLDIGFFFGKKDYFETWRYRAKDLDGYKGMVSNAIAERYHLPAATAAVARIGCRVRRLLAVQSASRAKFDDPPRLFLVQEWVGEDGAYVLEQATPFTQDVDAALDIRFPLYL